MQRINDMNVLHVGKNYHVNVNIIVLIIEICLQVASYRTNVTVTE